MTPIKTTFLPMIQRLSAELSSIIGRYTGQQIPDTINQTSEPYRSVNGRVSK